MLANRFITTPITFFEMNIAHLDKSNMNCDYYLVIQCRLTITDQIGRSSYFVINTIHIIHFHSKCLENIVANILIGNHFNDSTLCKWGTILIKYLPLLKPDFTPLFSLQKIVQSRMRFKLSGNFFQLNNLIRYEISYPLMRKGLHGKNDLLAIASPIAISGLLIFCDKEKVINCTL